MVHVARRNTLVKAIVVAFGLTLTLGAQQPAESPRKGPLRQYVVVLRCGPKWIAGKGVSEQPLAKHGRYLKELMDKGSLQYAGPFLDDSGGFILLNAADDAEAKSITQHDPAVMEQILEPEIHPIRIAFDAATGKSPFK